MISPFNRRNSWYVSKNITCSVISLILLFSASLANAEENTDGRAVDYLTGLWPYNPQIVRTGLSNEVGLDAALSHVSDLSTYWTYDSLHYYRLTKNGTYGARVNSAHRFSETALQYQAEAYPVFANGMYAAATLAYANQTQTLFASYQYRGELYSPLGSGYEISLGQGGQFFPRLEHINIYLFTGSIGKYIGNYYMWFRPYYFTPQSNLLCEVGLRKTFNDPNAYISVRASSGKLPDIGDLPPISNLVTLSESAIGLSGQIPLPKNFYLKPDISYEHQVYPGTHVRNIVTAFLGVFVRFD
jgi:YaiO family outer membrane protein